MVDLLDFQEWKRFVESIGPQSSYFYDFMPDPEDDSHVECVVLYEEPGEADEDCLEVVESRFQIVVRASDSPRARELIHAVYASLCEVSGGGFAVGERFVANLKPSQTPFPLEEDEDGHALFAVNFKMTHYRKR